MKISMSTFVSTFAITAISAIGFSSVTFATEVEIKGAAIDASGKNLIVNVLHGGGCEKHEYKLEMHGCAESMPVQCQATVNDLTFDACESFVANKVIFNLKDNGIDGEYYSNGSLEIKGFNKSSAVVRLPSFSGKAPRSALPPVAASAQKHVVCVTNANSDLSINAASTELTLTTADGQEHTYAIVGTDVMFIETMPTIQETTYRLDDGRKVVIEFKDGAKVGTGYFIRTTGDSSPAFKSCMITK